MASFSEAQQRNEINDLQMLDPQVIGNIYDHYFADIYRFVLYRLNDANLAEDIANDVFVRLLEAVKKKRGPDKNIKGWIFSTASHIVTDHLRRHYRRPTTQLPETLVDDTDAPYLTVERGEKSRFTREALQKLSPDQQTVIALRFGQGYSLEETATVMKKKVNAIKALQFRALAALRKHIGEVDDE